MGSRGVRRVGVVRRVRHRVPDGRALGAAARARGVGFAPGVGPRRGVAWRLRLDLWALLLGDPCMESCHVIKLSSNCHQTVIDQQLRLLLHTTRVVAENVDLVIIILINFIYNN